MRLTSLLLFSTLVAAASDSVPQSATADDVVAKMMERDHGRQAELSGYMADRRYSLRNERYRKHAEMVVRMKCSKDGSKQFDVVSSAGSAGIRKHVFPHLLSAEAEASQPGLRDRSRITPDNYSFEMVGTDRLNGRLAYVIAIAPKTPNKYLVDGRIWVDADEYAIVRLEGQPAKNPSFWVKSVHFVHTYAKQGPFWFPASDESVTDARIFGDTDLKIEYFGYLPNVAASAALNEPDQRSTP
jgi:negative regulator of sigma E activity